MGQGVEHTRGYTGEASPLEPRVVLDAQPGILELIMNREINPGRVFGFEVPFDEAAQVHRAMDERRAIKSLIRF